MTPSSPDLWTAWAGGGSEPCSWRLSWDQRPWAQSPEASCPGARRPGARLLLGCGSEAPGLWERRASRREVTRPPGHQRPTSSQGRGRALCWEKAAAPPLRTHPMPGMLRNMGSPSPEHPRTTRCQLDKGGWSRRQPPHTPSKKVLQEDKVLPESHPAPGAATEMRERRGSHSLRSLLWSPSLFTHHLQKLRDHRTEDQTRAAGCPQSLPRDSSALPPAVAPNTQEGPGTARAHLEDRTGPGSPCAPPLPSSPRPQGPHAPGLGAPLCEGSKNGIPFPTESTKWHA